MGASDLGLLGEFRGTAIDFDNHFYEPDDCYARFIDPAFRDSAFEVVGGEGFRRWALNGRTTFFAPPGLVTEVHGRPGLLQGVLAGAKGDASDFANMLAEGLVVIADHPEWLERDARLKLMDEQALAAVVMLPTLAIANVVDFFDLPDVLNANIRAFNRWVEEEWGYGQNGRIFSVPMLTLLDMDWAIEELERVANLGSRFFWLPHCPVNGQSPADPMFDPFWARVQEIGIKPVLHIGAEGFTRLYGIHWGEPWARYVNEYSVFQHYCCFGERPISDTIAAYILHNLFGRFPGIELITIENGSAWVPNLLRSMDKALTMGRNGINLGGPLNDLPSDTFRNHVYVNPYHEEDIVGLIDHIGADRILFGSDYPHPEGLAEPLDFATDLIDKISRTDLRKIMRDNAATLLGL